MPTLHFLSKSFKNVYRRNGAQDLMAKSVIKNSLVWFVCPVNFHVEAIGFTNLHETEHCTGMRVMPRKELAAVGIMRTLPPGEQLFFSKT